jgi:hypothetical protein
MWSAKLTKIEKPPVSPAAPVVAVAALPSAPSVAVVSAPVVAVPPEDDVQVFAKNGKILKPYKIQARSWQLVVQFDWPNLEGIKAVGRRASQNFYYAYHDKDVNELGEPVKNHWHLLMSFGSSRDLNTVKNYFAEFAITDEQEQQLKLSSQSVGENEPGNELAKMNGEYEFLLRKNSFEKIVSIKWAKRYLVHADDPNKFQYPIASVETNDNKFLDLFLDAQSRVQEWAYMRDVLVQTGEFDSFERFLDCFENQFPRMSVSQRISQFYQLQREYNSAKRIFEEEKRRPQWDCGYIAPPKTDHEKEIEKEMEDLPF